MGNSSSKNPLQVRQQIQQNLVALSSSSSLSSPANLTKIIIKYENSIPEKLHVVLYYELARQLKQILGNENENIKDSSSKTENQFDGIENISPEWLQFFIDLLEKSILCFQLYCAPIGGIIDEKVALRDLDPNHENQEIKLNERSERNVNKEDETQIHEKSKNYQKKDYPSHKKDLKDEEKEQFNEKTNEKNNEKTYIEKNIDTQIKYASPTIEIDKEALSVDPSLQDLYDCYLESHILLAHIFYERKEYEKALMHYLDGKYKNHFRLGSLYFAIEEFDLAIEEYKKITNYQNDIYTLNNIGVAYEEMSKWELAKEYFEKALNIDPNYEMAQFNLRSVEWKLEHQRKSVNINISQISQSQIQNMNESKSKMVFLLWKMNLGIVTHWEYALLSDEVYYCTPPSVSSTASSMHSSGRNHLQSLKWEILLTADQVFLARNGYFAIAFVNHLSRNVVISTRGTDDGAGVRADLWLTFDEFSIQFALSRGFTKIVKNFMIKKNISHYRLSYTGHSLGGAIGEYMCWEENTFGVTFDSIGSRKLIEIELSKRNENTKFKSNSVNTFDPMSPMNLINTTHTMNPMNPTHSIHSINPYSVDVVTYLTAPNLVNTIKPHVGLRLQIYPSDIDVPMSKASQSALSNVAQKSLPFYLRWVAPTSAYHTADYIYKELDKLIQHTYQQHAMKNIARTLSEPNKKEFIVSWPCGPLQCWTYTKGFSKLSKVPKKPLEGSKDIHGEDGVSIELNNQIVKEVYEDSLRNMAHYRVANYDESIIPLEFISEDLELLKQFEITKKKIDTPLNQDVKLLQSYIIEENSLRSTSFLTGCEFKQYIQINRQFIRNLISNKVTSESVSSDKKETDILSKL